MKPDKFAEKFPGMASALKVLSPGVPLADGTIPPIAVKILKFVGPQDGPGFAVQSALTTRCRTNPTGRHAVEYTPAIRAFKVTYTAPDEDPVTAFIPEHRVSCWYPAD